MEVDDITNDSVDLVEFVERYYPVDVLTPRASVGKDIDTTPGPAVAPQSKAKPTGPQSSGQKTTQKLSFQLVFQHVFKCCVE